MSEPQTKLPVPGLPKDFEAGESLPNPMLGRKEALSGEGKMQLKKFSGPRPGRFLLEPTFNWVVITATMWAATWLNHLLFYLVAIYFIGTRQNVLGLLIHEQTHYLCSRKNGVMP